MSKLVVYNSITLDGVMQAPGTPEEDTRGGFTHGGWARPYADSVMAEVAGEGMAGGGGILLGRWTYESLFSYWPHQTDNPFTDVLNNMTKYVASRTAEEPLPWENSTLLKGEASETIPDLKLRAERDVVVLGSGDLLQTLIRHRLIDEYQLLIHPLVLGTGRRMFPEDHFASLELIRTVPTTTGVVVATYRPADRA